MILAAIGAVAVFIAVVGYVSNVRDQYGSTTSVLVLNSDVGAYQAISPGSVSEKEVPARFVTRDQLKKPTDLAGMVAATNIPSGSYLSSGMLMPAPQTTVDQQEISILVDAETGVAGEVHPGSTVDVYATYDSDQTKKDSCAIRVLSNVHVLNIGNLTQTQDSSGGTSDSVPVTFALQASDALKLSAAESFAQKVRLGLRNPQTKGQSLGGNESCVQQITRSTK